MTLLAYGPAIDSNPIVRVELESDGSLTVELELEVGVETHRLPAMSVTPALRTLVRPDDGLAVA